MADPNAAPANNQTPNTGNAATPNTGNAAAPNAAAPNAAAPNAAAPNAAAPNAASPNAASPNAASPNAAATPNATPNAAANGTPTSSSSFAPIPNTAAAGVLTITQPAQTATSFYKIASGSPITFAWSFQSILATPTHLTVSAVCDNGNTYPVGPTDGIIPGTATEVVWDLWGYQQANPDKPLAQAQYTLNIWDDRGPGSPIKPGFMQENSGLKFAMYTPQPYTALASGWTCDACSGSLSQFTAHPAFVSLVATILIAVFSGVHLLLELTNPR